MSGSEGCLQPCSDAFSATERPGDATAGPTPPARGPLEPWRGVGEEPRSQAAQLRHRQRWGVFSPGAW